MEVKEINLKFFTFESLKAPSFGENACTPIVLF